MLKLKILNNEKPINLKCNINFPDIVKPTLQEKETIPTEEIQEIVADDNFDGLSKVTVNAIPEDYVIPTGEINITENGTYDVKEKVSANVNVPGYDTSDATATAGDIATGKTAYISSGLVEGTGTISTPVTKGVVINSYDADGYPTDISIVGMTTIPNYYFYSTMDTTGAIFSRAGANFRLSNNITSIGDRTFYGCYNLELTSLPESLTYIGSYAFHGCQNLKITSIPAGVTSLPSYCFRACNSINELTILGDITSISSRAFETDANLEKVILPNVTSVPTLGSNVFNLTPISKGTGYIYVPDSLVDSFKSATNWSAYANQIRGVSEL